MKVTETGHSGIGKPDSRFTPVLLWLFLILIPVIIARVIFAAAITMEKQLEDSRMRQKFNIELKKYDTALEPRHWIRHALHADDFDQIMHKIYKNEAGIAEYLRHPFLASIRNSGNDPDHGIEAFSKQFRRFTGATPDIIIIIASETSQCGWRINAPFSQPHNDQQLRQILAQGWLKMSQRQKNIMAQLPDYARYLSTDMELSRLFGIFDFVSTGLNLAKLHFSTVNNNELFISLLPIPDATGRLDHRFILSAVSAANLNPRFMLKTTCQRFSNTFSKHSFGSTSLSSLPRFFESEGRLSLLGPPPESFRKLAWKHIERGEKPLNISISDARQENSETRKTLVSIILLAYALTITVAMLAIKSGRARSLQSIQKIVAAGLFAGMLLPLSGSIWFGICYLNTSRHLEAEDVLDRMRNAAFITDQSIKTQLARNVLFRNLFTEILSGWQPEKLKTINDQTGFFAEEGGSKNSGKKHLRLGDLIDSYIFYHPDLDDIIGMCNNRKKITETPYIFVGGHARNMLHQLGAMDHLPPEKIHQVLNRSQYTMGFLDNIIDNRLTSKTFAEEKAPIPNAMSTRREQLTTSIWRGAGGRIKGISILQTTASCWFYDFSGLIESDLISQVFSHNGYRIFLNLYLRQSYNHRSLTDQSVKTSVHNNMAWRQLWPLAEALYSFGDSLRLNNLDAPEPHLIFTTPAADGDIWIMAYARPEGSGKSVSSSTGLLLLAVLAVLCGLVLARGLSRVLLRPIPALEEAVAHLGRQNFNFRLQINNGDEFDRLAAAFNQASRKLFEKQQLSQLVSRNVLDAIAQDDEHLLKPGGSRVRASILFSDIRGFTTISEKYPPEEVVAMLNDYFSSMADCIESNGGLIDKLIGDAIQAVFYAHENENCAESAVKAGLAMRAALREFNLDRQQNGLFTIENGVGICTGSVISGRVGSEQGMLDATVIGSLVAQAAQLESRSKSGNASRVMIDAATSSELPAVWQRQQIRSDRPEENLIELL